MIIYKITNKINGKVYIGQTIKSLQQRWSQHCCDAKYHKTNSVLHKAIIKYGAINFIVEQIDVACDREELNEKEKHWIKSYNSIIPNGYNIDIGGFGGCSSEEHRERISKSLKIFYKTHDNPMKGTISPMRGKIGAMKGRKHSEETKQKMSEMRSGINSKVAKKVMCVETGEIFTSGKEASDKYNISRSCICCACKGKGQTTAGNFHWKYVK